MPVRRHVQYQISADANNNLKPLWWVYKINKFMTHDKIPHNANGICSFTNIVRANSLKKALKILDALLLEYPEYEITCVKRIFDRTKKWPRGKDRVYTYPAVC
jgi:hypothetical protein